MMHGRNNGKKLMTVRIVKHSFEIIHLLSGEVIFISICYICPNAKLLLNQEVHRILSKTKEFSIINKEIYLGQNYVYLHILCLLCSKLL